MPGGRFPSTHYSLLVDMQSEHEPLRQQALDRFVEAYWKPAYKYIRLRWRKSQEDSEDLTQSFFLDFLEQGLVARFDAGRASFRTFLRLSLDSQVQRRHESEGRLKRGGGTRMLSLDFPSAERELPLAAPDATPEEIFYREWQRQMFALAVEDLRALAHASRRAVQFEIFEAYDLAAEPRPSYQELGLRHQLAVTTVTNHLAWARRELRRLMLERLAGITSGESEFRSEARRLFSP
ncbi:MAG: sigma-70 family RNA polymerase sigma factor [Acidobacteria bacterium]|nr:sigma-70 family RNA polymerase sigma factor [Acidobacteriota bacterium]